MTAHRPAELRVTETPGGRGGTRARSTRQQTISLNIVMDYVTLAFSLWNFALVGLAVIFWHGPLWIQQGYLILISALIVRAARRQGTIARRRR